MDNLPILDIQKFDHFDHSGDFYVNEFSTHLHKNHTKISHPHKHDFYLTVLFTHGKGIHEIDFERYSVEPGSVFTLKPGQAHYWEFTPDIEGIIFFHSRSFYEEIYSSKKLSDFPFFYSYQNSPKILLDDKKGDLIKNLFEKLFHESSQSLIMKKQKTIALIDLIYLELAQLHLMVEKNKNATSTTYYHKVNQLEELIDLHFISKKSPKQYASLLDITPKHLNRTVREVLNKTTSELIMERVILEAKRELLNSSDSLENIAWHLGYEDYAYFSRLFKKHCSLTPSAFQKKYLHKNS